MIHNTQRGGRTLKVNVQMILNVIIMTIRMMMMPLDFLAGMWWLAEEEVYS